MAKRTRGARMRKVRSRATTTKGGTGRISKRKAGRRVMKS